MKRIAKRMGYLTAALLLLVVLLAGYTQTQLFRDQVRSIALSQLNSVLAGDLYLGTISGNLITNFSIDSVALALPDGPVLTVGPIEAHYDPFALPRKAVTIHRLTLRRPRVRLATGTDGTWNFSHLVIPSPEDTSGGGSSDWDMNIGTLEISDGSFELTDSVALRRPDHGPIDRFSIEYHELKATGIGLELTARINSDEKNLTINRLSLREELSGFELRHLSGEFSVAKNRAGVRNLSILTAESSVELDAAIKEFDLLGGIDLAELKPIPVELALRNSDVSLNELGRFIPDINFLNGTVSIDFEASGLFGELQVRRLNLAVGQTVLNAEGSVFNLHRPERLYLDIRFSNSKIFSPDAHHLLSSFNLPDLESLGVAGFDLSFTGEPIDFRTTIQIVNRAGKVEADVDLAIGGPNTLEYTASASFREIDLSVITQNNELSSLLTGSVDVSGVGVDLDHLKGSFVLDIDSSQFRGSPINASKFTMAVERDRLEGLVELELGALGADLRTEFDGLTTDLPTFSISGLVHSLDIAEIVHDGTYDSDITMTLQAHGEGLAWSDMSGRFDIDFVTSRYQEYYVDSGSVRLTLDQRNPRQKEIRLESSIADLDLSGEFDLAYMLDLIEYEKTSLESAIRRKFAVLDSSWAHEKAPMLNELAADLAARGEHINAELEVSIKDLEPVSILTGDRGFNGVGKLTGKIEGDFSNISISADIAAEELFYGNVEAGFYMEGGTIELDIENLKPVDDPLRDIVIRFFTEAEDLHLNRSEFDTLKIGLVYDDGRAAYYSSGSYGDELDFSFEGSAEVSREALEFHPRGLRLAYRGEIWELDDDASLLFRKDEAAFQNIVMRHDSQEVRLSGSVGSGSELKADISINRIGLDMIGSLFSEPTSAEEHFIEGEASMDLHAGGTVSDPRIEAGLKARSVVFRGLPFGEMDATLLYEESVASIGIIVADDLDQPDVPPKFSVSGELPFIFPFSGTDDTPVSRPMRLRIRSDGIQINFLDPLLPTFDDLTGILLCDLTVSGPPDDLSYSGTFSLDECAFLFAPNNIRYRFAGQFAPEGRRIEVLEAVARNIPSDNRPGRTGEIRFTGNFSLRDFVPTDFNLNARGELLVVKPESRRSSLPVYGELYIETGSGGLQFTGTIQKSLLRGHVFLQRSRLIFPPTTASASRRYEFIIPIVVLDDTTAVDDDRRLSFRERYFQLADTTWRGGIDANESGRSFLDGIEYDLTVETTGPSSEIRLVFSEIPTEELQAYFQGNWTISDDGTRWIGDMTIDRAQYTFFKQFDATGKLRYSGEFMDPELDILASYQSTRTVQNQTDSTFRTERVVVNLHIGGTRSAPKQTMSMTIDDLDYYSYNGPKSSDLQSDAIAFIIAGNFPLTRSESSNFATTLQTSVGASMVVGASSLLTKELSDYLRRETGFITSVELGYESQGSFSESADIRLSGTAFKGYWRYSGTILNNPFNNLNVSLLYSFGDILGKPSLRNFMFELERRSETGTTGLIDDRKEVNSARLFYRFSF